MSNHAGFGIGVFLTTVALLVLAVALLGWLWNLLALLWRHVRYGTGATVFRKGADE